ncbi:MAG TPA: hypothetical protein PKX92_09320 [Edaphocola sp.]|nr:hypothetical protein [Edaphocola sp.]
MKLFYPFNSVILALCFFSCIACSKIDTPTGTPKFVEQKIKSLLKQKCPSVETVYQYSFQGRKVYVFHPKPCGNDFTSLVIDSDGNEICFLGGLSGNMECNGLAFYQFATDEKLIWKE